MASKRYRLSILIGVLVVCAVVGCGVGAFYVWNGPPGESPSAQFDALMAQAQPVVVNDDTEARIKAFCGDCHNVPLPDSFPRYAWHDEVRLGYAAYAKSGRQDLKPPTMQETIAYYRERAPEQLTFPDPAEAEHKLKIPWRVEHLKIDETGGVKPAVANLDWIHLQGDAKSSLVVTDMRRGTITAVSPGQKDFTPRVLAQLNQPCHIAACDLDGDSRNDLVVADLGSMLAVDHHRGRVVWLRSREGKEPYEPVVIASGLGRVADVRPADFDNDGDIDLLVAVFGMDRTGDIRMLWNVAKPGETPKFEPEIIDPRPGPIHVPPYDFDGDGYLDFAALVSQECEQVAVFMNQLGTHHDGVSFHMQSLWEGPDLTFGSSGIKLVDMDGDGDMDVLYTNGDAFDNSFVNPRHGIQWLENQGQLKFAYHRLTDLVGAYVASAGDLDLDGDLDIIAVAWLPSKVEPANVYDRPLASIICLEQTEPGTFVRHTLEKDSVIHAAMNMADYDGDGDLDFAVGYHSAAESPAGTQWVDIWWNGTKSAQGEKVTEK